MPGPSPRTRRISAIAGSGFVQRAPENSLHPFAFPGQAEAPFWTNTFVKEDITGRQLVRVFWSWYNPLDEDAQKGMVHWQAAKNPRWHFGNTRALYKMYFTSVMSDPKKPPRKARARASPAISCQSSTNSGEGRWQVGKQAVAAAKESAEQEQPEAEKPATSESRQTPKRAVSGS